MRCCCRISFCSRQWRCAKKGGRTPCYAESSLKRFIPLRPRPLDITPPYASTNELKKTPQPTLLVRSPPRRPPCRGRDRAHASGADDAEPAQRPVAHGQQGLARSGGSCSGIYQGRRAPPDRAQVLRDSNRWSLTGATGPRPPVAGEAQVCASAFPFHGGSRAWCDTYFMLTGLPGRRCPFS